MSELPITYYLYIAAFLFSSGIFILITKRSAIMVLVGIELMLNASNILFIVGSSIDLNGQVMAIFSIVITVCEVAIALSILLNVYRLFRTSELSELNKLGN